MSIKVKELLKALGIESTHEEREEIDKLIEQITGKYCDEGIKELTTEEFLYIVNEAKKRVRRRKALEGFAF